MQICTSPQTHNHASIPPLNFCSINFILNVQMAEEREAGESHKDATSQRATSQRGWLLVLHTEQLACSTVSQKGAINFTR